MASAFSGKAKPANSGAHATVPPGSHPAALVALVDLGIHQEVYKDDKKGERKVDVHKIMLVWELTAEPVAGQTGVNHLQARDYTLAFSPKAALRKMMESWRGKAYQENEEIDPTVLLGKKCLVTVSHKTAAGSGNTYAKLDGITPLPRGMAAPDPKIKPVVIELGQDLPSWLPYLYGEPVKDVLGRRIPEEMSDINGKAEPVGAGVGGGDADVGGGDADEIPF